MRCDDLTPLLWDFIEVASAPTGELDVAAQQHIESCLRCQAELARSRKMHRALLALRTRYLQPSPGLLDETLTALDETGERQAVRLTLTGRRFAYVGAIGGAAVAAGAAATAVLIARSRHRGIAS